MKYQIQYNFVGDDDLMREYLFDCEHEDIEQVKLEFYNQMFDGCRIFDIEVIDN